MNRSGIITQVKKIIRNECGAIALLYALALIPVVGMLGLTIDSGRIFYVNSVITGAVDSAAIAGGRAGGTNANITQTALSIFNANIPQNFIATIPTPTVTISNSSSGQVINVAATATI